MIQFIKNFWSETITPTIKASWDRSRQNTEDIINSIQNKEITRDVSINNPEDINSSIIEAQNATTQAIKDIPATEIPEFDLNSVESKLEAIKSAVENKEMSVNVGKTIVDTKGVIKAIERLQKSIPESKEQTDYTLMLDEMMKIMERPKDHSEIKKLQELLKPLSKTEDIAILAQYLQALIEKEYPILELPRDENGIPLFTPTKVGGGGSGGLTKIETDALVDLESKVATSAKQLPNDHDVTVSNMIPAVETGLATEAKQDDIISNQTDGTQKTQSVDGSGNNIGGKFYDIISGTYKGLQFNDVSPQICTQDYLLALAEGDIPGHSVFSKFGRANNVNNTLVDLWVNGTGTASVYVFPPSAIQFNLVSTSANDGAGTGVGILTVRIEGLDANYAPIAETVTLNGTSNVTTNLSYFRINDCYALTAGSAGVAQGTITVKNTGGTVTYSAITIGETSCRNLIYTVPAGKSLYLTSLNIGSGAGGNSLKLNAVTFTPKYRLFGSTVFYPAGELLSINSAELRPLEMPARFTEKTDIKMSVKGDYASGGTICTGAVRGWIE